MGGNHGRRLSGQERSEIRAGIAAGETHWEAAEAVDCSTKTFRCQVTFSLTRLGDAYLYDLTIFRSIV